MDPAFRQPPDLTDPAVCARECADLAAGMDQQSRALSSGTALGPPPNLAYYFNRVAYTLQAAAQLLTAESPGTAVPGLVPPVVPAKPEVPPDAGAQPPGQQKSGGKGK